MVKDKGYSHVIPLHQQTLFEEVQRYHSICGDRVGYCWLLFATEEFGHGFYRCYLPEEGDFLGVRCFQGRLIDKLIVISLLPLVCNVELGRMAG